MVKMSSIDKVRNHRTSHTARALAALDFFLPPALLSSLSSSSLGTLSALVSLSSSLEYDLNRFAA